MRREVWVVATLACLAALRVFVLASAFPFFHLVDEHNHVDSVLRYSRGEFPSAEKLLLDPLVARWSIEYGSYEYLESGPDIPAPHLRREGASLSSPEVIQGFRAYSGVPNVEFDTSPAAYYLMAQWYGLGRGLGLDPPASLYWTRWLNAVLLGLLVAGSYFLLRAPYADAPFMRLGVPALLAFFPQDVFYGVAPDNLSMFSGALAFVAVLGLATGRLKNGTHFALAGAAVSLTLLVKYTNGVYLVLAGLASLLLVRRRSPHRPPPFGKLATFWVAALLPIGLWLFRNLRVLGDAAGTARKMEHLEWAPKAWSGFFDHPLFTPSGALGYLAELLALFWRGEFLWHGQEMAFAWLDALYALSSVVLLGLAAWGVWRTREAAGERWTLELLAVLAVLGGFAQLALLSLRIEFADWGTPTRDAPFFVHGRLILGVLLPFALLFVRGLELACARLPEPARRRTPWCLLGLWLALLVASEIVLSAPAFESPYNWYHE